MNRIEETKKEIDRLSAELEKGNKIISNTNNQIQQIILARQEKIGYLKALEDTKENIKEETVKKDEVFEENDK
jgi:hypothetical protein